MKILHIIYSLSSGGAERFLVDLANELSQREDCDVRLLILKTDQDERNVFYKNELCIRVHLESLGIRKMSLSLFFKKRKSRYCTYPSFSYCVILFTSNYIHA